MPKTATSIALNSRLLAVYVQVTSAPDLADVAFLQAELLAIRDIFQPAQDPVLTATFDRYLRLIALHLSPQAQAALSDMLAETAEPAEESITLAFASASRMSRLGKLTGSPV